MTYRRTLFDVMATEVATAFLPIAEALDSPDALQAFLIDLGWQAPDSITAIGLSQTTIERLLNAFDNLPVYEFEKDEDESPDEGDPQSAYLELIAAIAALLEHISTLGTQLDQYFDEAFLTASDIADEIGTRIRDHLLSEYLFESFEALHQLLVVAGIVELREIPADVATFTSEHVRHTVHLEQLLTYTKEPMRIFRDLYRWGTPDAMLDLFLERLFDYFVLLNIEASLESPVEEKEINLRSLAAPPENSEDTTRELRIPIVKEVDGDSEAELGFTLYPLAPNGPAEAPGLAITIFSTGAFEAEIPLDEDETWLLMFKTDLDLSSPVALLIRPGQPIRLITDLEDSGAATNGSINVALVFRPSLDAQAGNAESLNLATQEIVLAGSIHITDTSVDWNIELANLGTKIAIYEMLRIAWDRFSLGTGPGGQTKYGFSRLEIGSDAIADSGIAADLQLTFKDDSIVTGTDSSFFQLLSPQSSSKSVLSSFHIDTKCMVVQWEDSDPDSWLNRLVPDFFAEGNSVQSTVSAQIVWGQPIREIRLDWAFAETPRTIALPGLIKITPPAAGFFSLLFGAGNNDLTTMAFGYTVPASNSITFASNFAWERGTDRELHNDADGKTPADPLFALALTPAMDRTLILAKFDLTKPTIDGLFLQPDEPLILLDVSNADTVCHAVETLDPFSSSGWKAKLTINYEQFQLPFLKDGDNQFIEIFNPNPDPTDPQAKKIIIEIDDFDKEDSEIRIPLGLRLTVGSTLNISTSFAAKFNYKTMSLGIEHGDGIHLYATAEILEQQFLGLTWRFKGKQEESGPNSGKYRLFTLVTDKYNYQIQQAPGSRIELSYNGISSDPIIFQVTDFAISDKGLNLRTTVVDAPVRLNGLDTKFRFDGSGIVIENSQIQSFTIAGSGALPPDLVGDSRASIALQFGRLNDGNLTLISGEAKLEGNNLLHCQGTRFQFSVDALGLKFVNDGKFHLYFTITGSAQFVLADGDDADGALALLPKIKLDLIEAPLTGDVSVIGKHIKFLVELPKPVSFSFLGCFEFELRGIGFEPQAEVFAGDGAMLLSGQLKFAQGAGDILDARIDFHNLHIGLPKPGSFLPRVYFKQLAVSLAISGAFKLNAVVDFRDDALEKGFLGEGMVEIQGLPSMAGAFGFLRVRRDEASPWLRAWFIYLEVRRVSFVIPVVQIYLREVGLGFGYRFTLASIKAADQQGDIRKLLQELRALSRTQGDLSKRDRWAVDLEEQGQDPRWTIVLRAMISQTAASAPTTYAEASEKELSCIYLFDAVIAFRSDFTFFMAVRGWFNTNYNDFLVDDGGIRNKPLLSGFVLLAPRQKRFLAHVASNPEGKIGRHPPLPDFVKSAIEAAEFSATLLIEPGLLHYEMGWPNMLRWKGKLGPLEVEFQGGFIFRISKTELVTGTSFMARGTLSVEAGVSFGFFGVSVSIFARVAYGARYIGVLAFKDIKENSAFYGAIGLELYIRITIRIWIKLLFVKKNFSFSLGIGFTAALEVGIKGNLEPGIRGQGTVSLRALGRNIRFGVKIGINDDAVDEAKRRTEKFLNIGLESTEVEALPGLSPQGAETRGLARVGTAFARRALALEPAAAVLRAAEDQDLTTPDYTIFAIRLDADHCYFVLLPAGERQGDHEYMAETGFLPTPPSENNPPAIRSDFQIEFPTFVPTDGRSSVVEQFVADDVGWHARDEALQGTTIMWKVNWTAPIIKVEDVDDYGPPSQNGTVTPTGEPAKRDDPILLQEYLAEAFIPDPIPDPASGITWTSLSDPASVIEDPNRMEDDRVYNPTDAAFESAVRGAFEQFRGSPFFKSDPNLAYDKMLKEAFDKETTIYSGEEKEKQQAQEQADQIRGVIIHDLIADLQAYVELVKATADPSSGVTAADLTDFEQNSLAFQMGLVFRVTGQRPVWLDTIGPNADELPQISQRIGVTATAPSAVKRVVRPFNTPRTSFANHPPRFDRVRHYTNSTTVGITWDLVWDEAPGAGCSPCQAEPEHHLLNYEVRRRSLDSQARDVLFTVKNGDILHRSGSADSVVQRLRPRFQLVDNFDDLTAEKLSHIPSQGLTYLYTITPIDFAKNRGRPLTVVATRYPDAPPRVPANGELTVTYRLKRCAMAPHKTTQDVPNVPTPEVIAPDVAQVQIQWTEPQPETDGTNTPIRDYQLVFRRETTLPIGSYGLDSSTQRDKVKALPSTNARTRPTDIIVPIEEKIRVHIAPAGVEGVQHNRIANIPLATLRTAKIFPSAAEPQWQPEAWRVFFRTVSAGGVPSALAPVQLKLRVLSAEPETDAFTPLPEERRPAELEWLPKPIQLPLLPPIDQKATTGDAHFPMPLVETSTIDAANATGWRFAGTIDKIAYQLHPAGLRAIRFRWNQAPSAQPDYPLNLNAGYELMELNIDAHTDDTLKDPEALGDVLRPIQEVQMLPPDDLILTPDATLVTTQWEAWYLSTQLRRQLQMEMQQNGAAVAGSESPFSPWYSWRESLLAWPAWPGLETGPRSTALHPFFEKLIEILQITAEDPPNPPDKYIVDVQGIPPLQPMTLRDFLRNTAPTADPYGWGILQRFGLSLTLSLREDGSSDLITADDPDKKLLSAIAKALTATLAAYPDKSLAKHLHVELLFQPGESVELQNTPAVTRSLLGIVQISLRPMPLQYLRYTVVELSGPAGAEIELVFGPLAEMISLILQSETTGTQIDLKPTPADTKELVQHITLPLNGKTKVLLRSASVLTYRDNLPVPPHQMQIRYRLRQDLATSLPTGVTVQNINGQNYLVFAATFGTGSNPTNPADEFTMQLKAALHADDRAIATFRFTTPAEFAPTSPNATYFLTPVEQLKTTIEQENSLQATHWNRFKYYAESLNSTETDAAQTVVEPRITVPTTAKELSDDNLLAQVLSWSQRFFDHCGPVLSLAAAEATPATIFAAQFDGPWLASAYPRAGTPAYATPDAAGRLKYFHLLEDKWAHNYRYYIRPYGRYDKLWRNLYLSPLLWPPTDEVNEAAVAPPLPNLDDGGLDLVLDRVRPVDMPTILRSGRLDRISVPGQPAEPGKIWEVIIAQHREQALSERNQTVYRQLAFRQIAYTLLRRFAYQDVWIRWDNDAEVAFSFKVTYPENGEAELPTLLEPTAYTIDDPTNLNPEDALRFALPQRLNTFQQGALVVQWEALPFYYAHRMLAIAQTTSQVSPVNSVIQQDFEYRAPEPGEPRGVGDFYAPFMEGTDAPAIRLIKIPLRRLWDSLPTDVQQRWPNENPAVMLEDQRRYPGILPDPEVVYQIIEYFQGNIEVQVELFLHVPPTEEANDLSNVPVRYERRTLGKRQLVEPQFITPQKAEDGESYYLMVPLKQVDNEGLINWDHEVALSTLEQPDLTAIPNTTLAPAPHCQLAWPGPMTADEARLLLPDEAGNPAIPGDQQFQLALAQLVTAATAISTTGPKASYTITTAIAPLGPEQPRTALPTGWSYQAFTLTGLPNGAVIQLLEAATDGDAPTPPQTQITLLRWTGLLFADGRDQLRTDLLSWASITELSTAVQDLLAALASRTVIVPYSGDMSTADLPEPLRPELEITAGQLRFNGLVQNSQQWTLLTAIPGDEAAFDEAFRTAVAQVIEWLTTDPIDIVLDLPLRPWPDALPDLVRDKLVIGRSLLHFAGIMSVATAKALRTAFPFAADQTAIAYLYRQSIQRGLTSRTLEIRTRRGSAEPSARRTLEAQALLAVEGANP